MNTLQKIGAWLEPDGTCRFTVWAPEAESVEVEITAPEPETFPLQKSDWGYWTATAKNISAGTRYFFNLDKDLQRPDPASMHQPDGVHQASAVVDHNAFPWSDKNWKNIPLEQMIIYELHTGTFTEKHTFEGISEKLDYLLELGINTIEIMPVAQFPGSRNWGYDGVYPFAVQDSYGGAGELKKLVNTCHEKGLAVVLDVVYNHMGPEGNYLNDFGPYFTDKYHTPWGKALNFDDAYCYGTRNFFIQNALMWFREFHIDGLRLDAVHAIMDFSARHFLQELAEETTKLSEQAGRNFYLIAESDLNDVRVINPIEKGGLGLDGQWSDDFHHAVHALITGEKEGYYGDFGKLENLEKVFKDAFVYNGAFSPHRNKSYGNSAAENPASQFVVCIQNHDQVGNRMLGERLPHLVSADMLKLAAATYLLSPYVPMLFMGEEYGEKNPFLYFISHTDKELVEAVRKGRKEEFKSFKWSGTVPDPQAEETFERSCLSWNYEKDKQSNELFEFYRHLIKLRKTHGVFRNLNKDNLRMKAVPEQNLLIVERWKDSETVKMLLNFSKNPITHSPENDERWKVLLDSATFPESGKRMVTPGSELVLQPESVVVLEQIK